MDLDFYGLFDWQEGDDDTYAYNATEFSYILKAVLNDGILSEYGDQFEVTSSGLNIYVGSGMAFLNGRIGKSDSTKGISITAGTRIDRAVLRCDYVNRKVSIEVLTGSTVEPELTQSDLYYEIPLAKLTVTSSGITVTDERTFTYSATQAVNYMNKYKTGDIKVVATYA